MFWTNLRNRGFTVIELLAVIVIIGLLAAVLAPVFSQARRQAKTASCAENLRQLATATQLYSADYSDRLPYAPGYYTKHLAQQGRLLSIYPPVELVRSLPSVEVLLQAYGAGPEIFQCPEDSISGLYRQGRIQTKWHEAAGSSYRFADVAALSGKALTDSKAGQQVLFFDVEEFHGPQEDRPETGRRNVVFSDGSLRSMTHNQLHRLSALPPLFAF
jgi:prepilin-type N-terminal cleavage/methylation domain-containing protein